MINDSIYKVRNIKESGNKSIISVLVVNLITSKKSVVSVEVRTKDLGDADIKQTVKELAFAQLESQTNAILKAGDLL